MNLEKIKHYIKNDVDWPTTIGVVVLAVLPVVNWYFNRESDADKARKSALVEQLLDASAARCAHGKAGAEAARTRLKPILQDTRSKHLDILLKNNVSVCLDERLAHQKKAYDWDDDIKGIFYQASAPVVSLWDDGTPERWGVQGYYDNGTQALKSLVEAIDGHDGYRLYGVERGQYHKIQWKDAQSFGLDHIKRNAKLQNAPVAAGPLLP